MITPFGNTQSLPLLPGLMLLTEGESLPSIGPSEPTPLESPLSFSSSSSCPCRDWLGQCKSPAECAAGARASSSNPVSGIVKTAEGIGHGIATGAKVVSSIERLFTDLPTFVTFLLGLLLIAAAIFTHPKVQETVVEVGKRAGEAAALA